MAEEDQAKKLPQEQPQELGLLCSHSGTYSGTPKKTSWPELVGQTSEEAERKIIEEMPGAKIQVIPPDHFVTMDYRLDRVRIFIDTSGKVAREPRIG